tara:strand:+ start:802 stop:1161 length:360 start_codon:yes stop_codon:yes gene_type:complete
MSTPKALKPVAEHRASLGDDYYLHAYSADLNVLLLEHRGQKLEDHWYDLFYERNTPLRDIDSEPLVPYYRAWNNRIYRLVRAVDTGITTGTWGDDTLEAQRQDAALKATLIHAEGAKLF